jgi:hypothetical protein
MWEEEKIQHMSRSMQGGKASPRALNVETLQPSYVLQRGSPHMVPARHVNKNHPRPQPQDCDFPLAPVHFFFLMVILLMPIKSPLLVSLPVDSSPEPPGDLDYLFTTAEEQNAGKDLTRNINGRVPPAIPAICSRDSTALPLVIARPMTKPSQDLGPS